MARGNFARFFLLSLRHGSGVSNQDARWVPAVPGPGPGKNCGAMLSRGMCHCCVSAVYGGPGLLRPEDAAQTMKHCKFATSALQYEDTKTAIENVAKAIHLLTGRNGQFLKHQPRRRSRNRLCMKSSAA